MEILKGEAFQQKQNPERGREMFKSTEDFRRAIEEGQIAEAEQWLNEQKKSLAEPGEGRDERWTDHRERELFQACYKQKDWQAAKRIVESSLKEPSKEGRIRRLEELSGLSYEDI